MLLLWGCQVPGLRTGPQYLLVAKKQQQGAPVERLVTRRIGSEAGRAQVRYTGRDGKPGLPVLQDGTIEEMWFWRDKGARRLSPSVHGGL